MSTSSSVVDIARLIRKSAEIHQKAWDETVALLGTDDHAEVLHSMPITHYDAVKQAADFLELTDVELKLVYALRKSWPEALQVATLVLGD